MRINILAGLIIMTLGAQCAVAANLNNYELERRIFDVSYQLNQIAQEHTTDLCSGDVEIAAAYLESGEHELQHQNKDRALVSMAYGHNELKEISNARSYCIHLAPKIKPYLAKVIVMRSELENITIPDTDQTSD